MAWKPIVETDEEQIDRLTEENEQLKAEVEELKTILANEMSCTLDLSDKKGKAEQERDRLLPVVDIAAWLTGLAVVGHLTRCTCSKCKDFLTVQSAINHKGG